MSKTSQTINVRMSKSTSDKKETCICVCALKLKDNKEKECPDHLKHWELWMQRRKKMHGKLRKLGREPGELLMNVADEYRHVKEDKLMLDYTKITTHFDKYRGNPADWALPVCLKSREEPYGPSEYRAVKSKEERNEIPVIEYVGVPEYVMKEKDVMPRSRNMYTLWKNSNYREQVIERMSSKVCEIEPHKPDVQNLVVVGTNLYKTEPLPKTNKQTIIEHPTPPNRQEAINVRLSEKRRNLALMVNDIAFNEDSSEFCNKITILFEHSVESIIPCTQTVSLKNSGGIVLRLHWSKYRKLKIFREFTERYRIFQPFKFNKNEILLLPGDQVIFSIGFQVSQPGNHIEYWELTTAPRIWSPEYHLVLELKGFATVKQREDRIHIIRDSLNQRVRNTVVKDLLRDIVSRGNYCAPTVSHSYDFTEKELFESVNLKNEICLRTAKYVYDKEIVAKLNDFYQEVRQADDPEVWDFSLKKLKEISRKRDLLTYFEESIAGYNTAKMRRDMLKEKDGAAPVKQQQDKGTDSKQSGKSRKEPIPIEIEPPKLSYSNKLKEIVEKLEKPSIRVNEDRKKFLFSYIVLRTYMLKMYNQLALLDELQKNNSPIENKSSKEKDIEDSDNKTAYEKQIVLSNIKLNDYQDRLLFECFDESYVLRTKRIPLELASFTAKPRTLALRGVSVMDFKKIFKVYFQKDEAPEKGQKKKAQVEDKGSKKPPSSKKTERGKGPVSQGKDLLLEVDAEFDPFAEQFPTNIETTEKTDVAVNSGLKNADQITNYEEKYLFVYTALCNAVDAIVTTVDGLNSRKIAIQTLGELQTCVTIPVRLDKNLTDITVEQAVSEYVSAEEKQSNTASTESATDAYFKYLLKSHWEENPATQKYFVKESPLKTYNIQDNIVEEKIIKITKPLVNTFSRTDFKRKPVPIGLKETGVQTSALDDSEGYETNFEREVGKNEPCLESKEDLSRSSSKNIFYFLDHTCKEDVESDEG